MMRPAKITFTFLLCLGASAIFAVPAAAQSVTGEQAVTVKAIPGVVAAGAKWKLAWQGLYNADGIVGTSDGGLLFAQEQTSTVQKLDGHEHVSVYLRNADGVGSLSVGPHGELYAAERTCTDPGIRLYDKTCSDPTRIVILTPKGRALAEHFADGSSLGRLNDLVADSKGGAYFTVGGAYYVNAKGVVSTVAEPSSLRSNGIMLSRDGKTLYVTNRDEVVAFDVHPDGSTSNRRVFARLSGGDNGADGMAIDGAGQLYVPGMAGVHVFSPEGRELGIIPAPRRPISLAFSGPDKKVLYAVCHGAVGPDGRDYETPKGVRNTAMSIYKISMVAQGFKGRMK